MIFFNLVDYGAKSAPNPPYYFLGGRGNEFLAKYIKELKQIFSKQKAG